MSLATAERIAPVVTEERRGKGRKPWLLIGAAWVVALFALAPIGFLLLQASQSGWGALGHVLFRRLTGQLLVNTVEMTVLTTLAAVILGVAAAWVLERTDVPCRRLFFVALLVPAAIPGP